MNLPSNPRPTIFIDICRSNFQRTFSRTKPGIPIRNFELFESCMDAPSYLPAGSTIQVIDYLGTSTVYARYTIGSSIRRY